MKNVKNLVLKGMLVGVALTAGVGAVVPAMKSDSVVMAAETENTAQTTFEEYDHISKHGLECWLCFYSAVDPDYTEVNGTYYFKGDGVTYELTYTEEGYETETNELQRTEEEAYQYAQYWGLENVRVTENENPDDHLGYKYTVTGEVMYGTVTVKIVTVQSCCPTENM